MNDTRWIPVAVLVVLLLLSALYSMAETAMLALSRGRVRSLVSEGVKRSREVERLIRDPNRLLGTVLFGNNVTNVVASTIATAAFISYFGPVGVAWASVVMAVVVLLLAEITPKTFAAHNPEAVALRLAPFLSLSERFFYPVVRLLTFIGEGVIRLFGGRAEGGRLITEEEIRTLVEVGEEEGLIEANERELIQGVFDFGDTVVREVMVPRIDVKALRADATLSDAWDAFIHWGHSRLPVYRETIDDVIGMIYARDLLAYLKERDPKTPVADLVRPVHYVPETKPISELLADFRHRRTQIAVVLDEYGGTAGIVTIEDLLEEIVGEIHDEYDTDEMTVREVEPGVYEMDGLMPIDEVNELLRTRFPHEDFDTVGGLILHLLGRAPVEGEVVEYEGWEFTVAKVVGRRVKRVVVRQRAAPVDPAAEGEAEGSR
ncbi:MAG: hemolysin family protein [Firmicutes bacterium]|nr:HlyC/CorC family transporter [Alicyclobacillaceae bacterium]MCL6496932.1 hemolysin family protein [Bacillota bacterium]